MGIVRVVEWKLNCSQEEAAGRLRKACASLGLSVEGQEGHIEAHAKRAILKNRWAADVVIDVASMASGSVATCRVDMAGTKHFEILSDLTEATGDDMFDDLGANAAIERLGKASRFFGWREVRHLRNILRATERVLEVGQGQFDGRGGLIVLTSERLFFFDKGLARERIEEFALGSISSLTVSKKRTGETLQIFNAGNTARIDSMPHGQGDALARAFQVAGVSAAAQVAGTPAQTVNDPIRRLEQLATLRDNGVLTDEEFDAKKRDILDRL